jgi:hypothetical protein
VSFTFTVPAPWEAAARVAAQSAAAVMAIRLRAMPR